MAVTQLISRERFETDLIKPVYYLDGNATAGGTGSITRPFSTWAEIEAAIGSQIGIVILCVNTDTIPIILTDKTHWTVASVLSTKGGGRANVLSIDVSSGSTGCYCIGLVTTSIAVSSTVGNNYFRYCTAKADVDVMGTGYTCFELCSFMQAVNITESSAIVDLLSCQCENASILTVNNGVCIASNCRNLSVVQGGGTFVSLGANNFQPPTGGTYAITTLNGAPSVTLLADGICVTPGGTLCPIEIHSPAWSVGKMSFDRDNSILPTTGETFKGLDVSQIHDAATYTNFTPGSADQEAVNKAIDEKIGQLQALPAPGNRGAVWSANTPQNVWSITTLSVLASAGGYAVGDVLFIDIPDPTKQKIKAWAIVNALDVNGGVAVATLSSPGVFTEDVSANNIGTATSGNGLGCTVDIISTQVPGSTLASIANPRQGDDVIVMQDETNGGGTFLWTYADRNGDGIANWIPVAPFSTAATVYAGDGTTIGVTSNVISLSAAYKALVDAAVPNTRTIAGVSLASNITAAALLTALPVTISNVVNL